MLLDIGLNKVDPSIIPSRGTLPTAPKSSGERFDLEFDAFQASEQFFSEERAKYNAYEDAVQELYSATGRRVENPYAGFQELSIPDDTGLQPKPSSRDERKAILADALRQARETNPSLPDLDEIEANAGIVAKMAHDAAFNAGLASSPWTGFAAFAGSVAGALTDPINLATLPLGVGSVTGSIALRILKTAAVEAGIAGGTQALIEAATYDFKTEAGIKPNPAFNILAAATGGAVLGGGVRGLIDGIRNIKARSLGLSLDEMDALHVAERNLRDVESNPLGPTRVEEHLQRIEDAMGAVIRGEAFPPQGPFSMLRAPVIRDLGGEELTTLATRQVEIRSRLSNLTPVSPERLNLAARVEAVESQLANPDLSVAERKALSNRRDELLASDDPAKLREDVAADRERRTLESELSAIESRANEINKKRIFIDGRKPTTSGVTQIDDAIKEMLPSLTKVSRSVNKGEIPPHMDPGPAIDTATRAIAAAKKDGVPLSDIVYRGDVDSAGRLFLRLMHDDDELTKPASKEAIAARLEGYADEASRPADDQTVAMPSRAAIRAEVADRARASMEVMQKPEVADAMILDAQRIAADLDPDVPTETGTVKASAMLEDVQERKRVFKEIADACLTGKVE